MIPAPRSRRRLQLEPFEFDTDAGELYRDGQRVPMQEKPRQVLAALIARAGDVVTRDELRAALWETDTFVDFEHGLNTAIKKVRKTLGDSAEAPRFIETLSRRGYRFIAPVRLSTGDGVYPVATAPTPPVPAGPRPKAGRSALLVLVAAAAFAGIWIAQRSASIPLAPLGGAPAQLAVLPMRMLPGSDAQDRAYLGVAVADAITTRLAAIRQIGLRPTSAVLPYKDAQSDPARIASALGVQYLLLGTIQPDDRSYRFTLQLVRSDGVAVWGRSYDEPRGGLLAVQDHVAEQVVGALRVELSPPERARLHMRYTENPAAYDLHLRGRALLVNYTEANMREAMRYFERAVALDPRYALAHASLATAAAWFSVRYAYEAEAHAWGKRADDEARRALQQDPLLADAHLAIASAAGTLFGGFNWKAVLDGTAEALALDPSLDLAHVVRMRAFYHLGLFERARDEGRLADALNPSRNVETLRLAVASQLFGGQYADAAAGAAALLRENDAPAVRQYLGLARYYTGDAQGAREMLASAMRGGKPDVRAQASLASIEAATGSRDQARARADAIARGSYMDHHVAYSLGAAYAQLGQPTDAMIWLQRAIDTGFPCLPWFDRDPLLTPVRSRPEFLELMTRMRRNVSRIPK